MNTINIHNGKYARAPLPELCAPRSELITRLDKAAKCRTVYICAPAGSGKTVSALLWTKGRKTVWIGLDAYDNSISVFYRLLCAGLLSAQPHNERVNAVLSDPSFDSSPVECTIKLLAAFLSDGIEYALALDDYHTISNNEIQKSLPYILRRMPNSFTTLILSRTDPNEHFTDFIERKQAAVVTAKDMAFSKNEIAEYFSLLGRKVSADDAQTVSNYTGGWAIGVNALAQSTAPIAALGEHGGQVLSNYIVRHLWREWEGDLREFMTASAVLDEMPVSLCVKITSRADAGEILEQLRMRNAFVSRVEDGVYRYHHLFLDFLRAQPEYAKMNKKKFLNAAAKYYKSIGDGISAQRYAYESGNTKVILEIFTAAVYNENFHLEEFLSVARDFYLAPSMEALCAKCPVLYMARAYVTFLVGDAKLCIDAVEKLKRSLPLILIKYPHFAEPAFACTALDFRISFMELAEKANRLPPFFFHKEVIKMGFLTLQMPFLQRINRDYHELSDPNAWDKVKNNYGKLYKDHYEAMYLCKSGGFLLEQNQPHAALTKALDAAGLIIPQMAREMRFAVHMHLSAAYLALNKSDELIGNIRETERFINNEAPFLRPNFLAFTTRVKLWDGDTTAAKEWLAHYFVNEGKTLELYRIYQYFTTARAYAALGELEKAKDLCLRLRQLGKDFNRLQDAAEAGVGLAVMLWATGKRDEAQKMLETVLLEIQPYEFIRLVADEGADILPVIKKLSTKCERPDYKGELNSLYVKSVHLAAYAVSKQRRGVIARLETKSVKLSKKQKLVIGLLAQGYNREGVMEKTGMALGTVKTHIRFAYEKLGADNAADAVLRARELGIIEHTPAIPRNHHQHEQ